MKSIETDADSPQQPATLTMEQALQQAISHHRAGQLQEAERLYRVILQAQPNHPDANHNLGVLAVQVKQPAAGLPHFKAALGANSNQIQYWLSYIDALIQSNQTDAARQVLVECKQRGFQGERVLALAERLQGNHQIEEIPYAVSESKPVALPIPQGEKNQLESKQLKPPGFTNKAGRHSARGKEPSTQEVSRLSILFNQQRYPEAEALARTMTERFPRHGFGWKVLGAALQQQGRVEEALVPKQKAAMLLPNDAEAHNNLGKALHEQGLFSEAEASHRRALEIKPDYAAAHNSLGVVLKHLGRLGSRNLLKYHL